VKQTAVITLHAYVYRCWVGYADFILPPFSSVIMIEVTSQFPDKNSNHTATVNNCSALSAVQSQSRGPLQPYQGRNPCMERNLMLQAPSDEELSCNGNTLVDRSSKHTAGHYMSAFESQSLVSHDYLGMSQGVNNNGLRPATPIPYVQNAVYDSSNSTTYATIPKQPNIPGNGSALSDGSKSVSKWGNWGRSGGWGGLRKLLDSKKHLLFGMYTSKDRCGCEHTNRMVSKDNDSLIESDESKSNLLVRQNGLTPALKKSPMIMETQVCLLPGSGKKNGVVTSVMSPLNRCSEDNRNGESIGEEEVSKTSKNRRPSTLPLVKQNSASRQSLEEHFQQVFGMRNSDSTTRLLKDPNSRVKTPGDVPPSVRRIRGKGNSSARFSLYDDRMMTTSDYCGHEATLSPDGGKSIENGSVGQTLSCSVPTNIDISCNGTVLKNSEVTAASSFWGSIS
jgi:bone morphogenetic protein receptor type-2